jgi:hypothetical protein
MYAAFEFELEAPANAEAAFTLTQSNPTCTGRIDGDYFLSFTNFH